MFRQFLSLPHHVGVAIVLCAVARIVLSAPEDIPAPSNARDNGPALGEKANDVQKSDSPRDAAAATNPKQSYVGTNQCFTCHRPQTDTWSETKHSHAFTNIPKKYQNDPGCLKCHVTGFGKPNGYVAGTDKDLLMVGCEACHGPGALHVEAAKRFVMANPGEEVAIEKEMKETITKIPSDKVCAGCHVMQAHQKHPAYDGQVSAKAANTPAGPCGPASVMTESSKPTAEQSISSSKYSIKTCGGCHYDQYEQWRTGTHANLAAMLPVKYSNDQSCQNCHSNPAPVVKSASAAKDPHHHWVGVACESCHGAALEHIQFVKQFIGSPILGPKLELAARDAIHKGKPDATCILCHVRQTHKQHPQFEHK
jgi:nitrate/TMAO reductase-like tetraheme cytochrome c subunit